MVWWPKFIRVPRIRLSHIRLKAPPKPSSMMIFTLCLIFAVFVLGGGIYMYANIGKPWLIPLGTNPSSGDPIIVYPGLDRQLIIEGLVIMIFLLFGFGGSLILYDSNKHVYTRSYALKLLFIGILLIGFCFIGFWYVFTMKLA